MLTKHQHNTTSMTVALVGCVGGTNNQYEVFISTNETSPSKTRGYTWYMKMKEGIIHSIRVWQGGRQAEAGRGRQTCRPLCISH
jgi:hypothetical protein